MPSFTSNSEAKAKRWGSLSLAATTLTIVLSIPILIGYLAGRRYHPQALAVPSVDEEAPPRIVLFGNSRIDASVDTNLLARYVTGAGLETQAISFSGGGWDALHFYQLAILNQTALRPGRDVVVIEVSPLSLNDANTNNRLGTIRPEAAWAIASLPGLPTESRLDILFGSAVGLYRYRGRVQGMMLQPRLEAVAHGASRLLAHVGLLGPVAKEPDFKIISAPGREFVVQEIQGNRSALLVAARAKHEHLLASLDVGHEKLEALRRNVNLLRSKKIEVFLLQVPTSRWLNSRLYQTPAGQAFLTGMMTLQQDTGAHWLNHWPESMTDEAYFFDEEHMTSLATVPFTGLLAETLTPNLPWRQPGSRTSL